MMRIPMFVIVVALLLVILVGCEPSETGIFAPKPNIIVICADDLGYGDLGSYGQSWIETPVLDQMAKEGVRFTQFYAGSSVGIASRGALLTGMHTGQASIRAEGRGGLRPDEPTLGTLLKDAGYHTACIGKWGLGRDPQIEDVQQAGFDYFFGYLNKWHAHNAYPSFLWRNEHQVTLNNGVDHPPAHPYSGQESVTGVTYERQVHSHDLFTEDALAYIQRHKPDRFFLWLNYTLPHANVEATDTFRKWLEKSGHSPQAGGVFDVNIADPPLPIEVPDLGFYAEKDWPEVQKAKAAAISRLDASIGQIFDRLKALGLAKDTLVIFTSDNGPHRDGLDPAYFNSDGPFRGHKGDLYEGGIRVPLIAWWPQRIEPNTVTSHVSAAWDLLPTLADLAGVEKPATQGISLVPGFMGKPQPEHEYLYWESHIHASAQAVRMGKWKAVRTKPSNPIELYNLDKDLGERNNVAEIVPGVIIQIEKIMEAARLNTVEWPLRERFGKASD